MGSRNAAGQSLFATRHSPAVLTFLVSPACYHTFMIWKFSRQIKDFLSDIANSDRLVDEDYELVEESVDAGDTYSYESADDPGMFEQGELAADLLEGPDEERREELLMLKQRFQARKEARERRRLRAEMAEQAEIATLEDGDMREAEAEEVMLTPEEREAQALEQAREVQQQGDETGDEGGGNVKQDGIIAFQGPYEKPTTALLESAYLNEEYTIDEAEIQRKMIVLQETLDIFGIDAQVANAIVGPRITQFIVDPSRGVKVESITQITKNIAMDLQAESVRIQAPIPGESSVGIEIPNRKSAVVGFYEMIQSSTWRDTKARIPLALGKNIRGKNIILDLAKAPHLLIAGATGSGKSVCMNGLILSMLYQFTPEDLRMILVDPKIVEFSMYAGLPHLITPVVTETRKLVAALGWTIREMGRRYQLLAGVGVRNIEGYNMRDTSRDKPNEEGEYPEAKLPYLVVVIDELADIMLTARADVENSLARIAQLSRAVGIHTIVATQRPSVNVITGTIKANYPTRIAFQVSSQVDSRTILDGKGAETLCGRGDMLFNPPGTAKLERIQSPMVHDQEVMRVVEFVATQAPQQLNEEILQGAEESEGLPDLDSNLSNRDEALIREAIEIIRQDQRATTSHLQRRLRIGYNKAATFIDILEDRGIIGPQVGNTRREILID